MKSKTRAGLTLLELIIAVAILALVGAPIFGMWSYSVSLNASAHRMTIASFAAQQRMEELLGRPWQDDLEYEPWGISQPYNGLYVRIENHATPEEPLVLLPVDVYVYLDDSAQLPLLSFHNILNVISGGFG